MLIADDGRIKLGDFGLARAISTSTSTGALIGTVAYLSPSSSWAAGGRPQRHLLGRDHALRDDHRPAAVRRRGSHPGRLPARQLVRGGPSELVPGLAGELDELVQWCTANDPDKRPVNGTALLSELRHIRRNLSDAELDLQPPAARPALPPVPPAPSPPVRPPGAQDPVPATAPPK
ncbi:hypothetical protein PJ267_06140 [Arthrobacter sp. OVS8]|nr:hypothetical protein PJ267_06140 [Arthrobacter sp. OVS8]